MSVRNRSQRFRKPAMKPNGDADTGDSQNDFELRRRGFAAFLVMKLQPKIWQVAEAFWKANAMAQLPEDPASIQQAKAELEAQLEEITPLVLNAARIAANYKRVVIAMRRNAGDANRRNSQEPKLDRVMDLVQETVSLMQEEIPIAVPPLKELALGVEASYGNTDSEEEREQAGRTMVAAAKEFHHFASGETQPVNWALARLDEAIRNAAKDFPPGD